MQLHLLTLVNGSQQTPQILEEFNMLTVLGNLLADVVEMVETVIALTDQLCV